MSETPRPLWAIVEKFSKAGEQEHSAYRDARLLIIGELAAALRAWNEQIRAGIEKREATVHPFGPLYGASTEHAAQAILDNILGVPPKEPATEKK